MFTPIFVIGLARSGTTIVGKMISQHYKFAQYEAETLLLSVCSLKYGNIFKKGRSRENFLYDWFRSRQHRVSGLTEEEFIGILAASNNYSELLIHFLNLVADKSNKNYIVDSTPGNSAYISDIKRTYEASLFINVIRDGRDVAISQTKLGWVNPPRPFRSRNDYLHYALVKWQSSLKKVRSQSKGAKILNLKYEEVVEDPQSFKEMIETFLEIEGIDTSLILDFSQSNSAFSKSGSDFSSPVGRWRSLEKDTIENICFGVVETLKEYGYADVKTYRNPRLWVRYYYFRLHIFMKACARNIPALSKYTSESIELNN